MPSDLKVSIFITSFRLSDSQYLPVEGYSLTAESSKERNIFESEGVFTLYNFFLKSWNSNQVISTEICQT